MRAHIRTFCLSCALLGGFSGCKPAESGGKVSDWIDSTREHFFPKEKPKEDVDAQKANVPAKSSYAIQYEASQAKAVAAFPELGVAGSAFNLEFLSRVKILKSEDIKFFNNPEWPYDLAKRVNEILRSRPTEDKAVSAVLISQRPSFYVGQLVNVIGTVVKVNGYSIHSTISIEFDGGLKAELAADQVMRKQFGPYEEWSDRFYKLDSRDGAVVFLQRNLNSVASKEKATWGELFHLRPGSVAVVKGQVIRMGDRSVIKGGILLDWGERL